MMNELKPEDVFRELYKLKYGGHSCSDCKYAKWSGEDRCGLNGCRIAKAALDLLHEYRGKIADYMWQITGMQKEIAQKDSKLTALLQYKQIEADKDAEIEKLKAENATYANGIEKVAENYHKQGKVEAINELEQRLIQVMSPDYPISTEQVHRICEELKGVTYETDDSRRT